MVIFFFLMEMETTLKVLLFLRIVAPSIQVQKSEAQETLCGRFDLVSSNGPHLVFVPLCSTPFWSGLVFDL